MKKIMFLCLLIIFCMFSLNVYSSQPPTPDKFIQGIFVNLVGDELQSEGGIQNLVTDLQNDFFNTIFPQIRMSGKVIYQSKIEPLGVKTTETFTDPLLTLIDKSTPLDLTKPPLYIIPWINIFEGYPADLRKPPFSTHFLAAHPDWVMIDKDGNTKTKERIIMVDPLVPAAQAYIITLLSELIQVYYKIPAIYIGDLCYPEDGNNWGYNPITLALYNSEKNKEGKPEPSDPDWCQWRREKLTEFLSILTKTLKEVRPNILIAVGVLAEGDAPATINDFKKTSAYNIRLQDVPAWIDKELVDVIVLKNYFTGVNEKDKFSGWLDFMSKNKKKASLIVAVDGRRNFTNSMIDQLREIRSSGVSGSVINHYRQPVRDNPAQLYASLKTTVFKEDFITLKTSGIEYDLPPLDDSKKEEDKSTKTLPLFTPAPTVSPSPTPTPFPDTEIVITPSVPSVKGSLTEPQITPTITPRTKKIQTDIPSPSLPTSQKWDRIYLKNGSMFEGKLIEEVDGVAIIENKDSFQVRIKADEIEKIVRIID